VVSEEMTAHQDYDYVMIGYQRDLLEQWVEPPLSGQKEPWHTVLIRSAAHLRGEPHDSGLGHVWPQGDFPILRIDEEDG
jgi:hypothetical protein